MDQQVERVLNGQGVRMETTTQGSKRRKNSTNWEKFLTRDWTNLVISSPTASTTWPK
jgi:hypothetical protein